MFTVAGLIAGAVLGILVGAGAFGGETTTKFVTGSCDPKTNPDCKVRAPTHWHADFAIFVDGQRMSFKDDFYIAEKGNEERTSNVHIHEPYTDVVHVHYTGTTWDEFLTTIGMDLFDPSTLPGTAAEQTTFKLRDGRILRVENGKTFKFYVNGVRVDGVSHYLITDLDRVLISYGGETEEQVKAQQLPQVKDDACILSESCKARIPADVPPEKCQGGEGTTCAGN